MEDQYGMADLGQYMNGKAALFPPPQDLLSSHRGLAPPYPYDMIMFRSDNTGTAVPLGDNSTYVGGGETSVSAASGGGLSMTDGGGDGASGRWPRQETLTLLEIRSRLDSKFKEANQKGPLWDEVSRIMSEEHAYQRNGKKCREKFENLYKYYKKTKEGKAGRQDGKHYRFFRQLEALYGETNNSASVSETHLNSGSFNPNVSNPGFKFSDTSLSLSNTCDYDPTSSDDDSENDPGIDENNPKMKKGRGKRGWKGKIEDFIDAQMKKLIDKQEAWMQNMMKTIEDREKERIRRDEEWRKQDAERLEREHNLWSSERAWIEARDASLMETLHKMITRKESRASPQEEVMVADIPSLSDNYQNDDGSETMTNSLKGGIFWPECEVSKLIQLRNGMEQKFQQCGISEEVLWEEIATKMACFGHEKSGLSCREKWERVNNNVLKSNKKRKENSRICSYYQSYESICNQGGGSYCDHSELNRNNTLPLAANNTGNGITDACIRYYMGDVYGRIVD